MIDYKSSAPPRAKTPDGCAVYCSFDKIVPIRELKPNPANPNTHGDGQIKLLGDIIESTGWRAPITVSKRSGLIVKGHGRRMAAIHKGLQYAPVEYQDYATDAEERADLLADNRIAELAEMDEGKLADMIKDIQGEISTELAGYTDKDIENLLGDVKPDTVDDGGDAEEKEFPAVCKPGDLWHLGRHRLLCGSATNEADISRLMGSERANLIHTDPPYGVSYVDISGRFRMIKNDHLQGDELLQKLLIPAFKNMVKYSADDAAFYIWYAQRSDRAFMDALDAAGIEWSQIIIWVKNNFTLSHNDYEWNHEPCFYGRKSGGKKPPFYGDRSQTTTWKVTARGRDSMATVLTGGVLLTDGAGAKLYITDEGKEVPNHQAGRWAQHLPIHAIHKHNYLDRGQGFTHRPPEPEAPGAAGAGHPQQHERRGFSDGSIRREWFHPAGGRNGESAVLLHRARPKVLRFDYQAVHRRHRRRYTLGRKRWEEGHSEGGHGA